MLDAGERGADRTGPADSEAAGPIGAEGTVTGGDDTRSIRFTGSSRHGQQDPSPDALMTPRRSRRHQVPASPGPAAPWARARSSVADRGHGGKWRLCQCGQDAGKAAQGTRVHGIDAGTHAQDSSQHRRATRESAAASNGALSACLSDSACGPPLNRIALRMPCSCRPARTSRPACKPARCGCGCGGTDQGLVQRPGQNAHHLAA